MIYNNDTKLPLTKANPEIWHVIWSWWARWLPIFDSQTPTSDNIQLIINVSQKTFCLF